MALTKEINRARWTLELARSSESEQITDAIQLSRIVGLLGEGEVGKTETVRSALGPSLPDNPVIHMDLEGAASDEHLAFRLVRQVALAELGTEFSTLKVGTLVPASLERKRVDLANLLTIQGLEEALRDWPSGELPLAHALQAVERLARRRETILWIDHLEAPGLTPRHPLDLDRLLWAIREMVQTGLHLSVVLSGRDAVEGRVLGREAAFHQQGQWLSLDNPTDEVWETVASSLRVPLDLAAELTRLTGGHPETMLAALATHVETKQASANQILSDLASTSVPLLNRSVQHACTLHRLGGKVLEQIALGHGPYAGSQRGDSPPQEIRKVLGRLQMAGLIRHDRGWSVVNPSVGILLRREIATASAPDWGMDELDS
ncbi:MAG TPA: hypothetical protein VFU11_04690 [Solirubrobacterales bacterium]|nr:hypothetical protein [Solirubrobacterales bacterium]